MSYLKRVSMKLRLVRFAIAFLIYFLDFSTISATGTNQPSLVHKPDSFMFKELSNVNISQLYSSMDGRAHKKFKREITKNRVFKKKTNDANISNNIFVKATTTEIISRKRQQKDKGGNQYQNWRSRKHDGNHKKQHKKGLRLTNTVNYVSEFGSLFPPLFNVAIRASISANGTCGESQREEYCILMNAYPHKNWDSQCGICDANSSDVTKQRPIQLVVSVRPNLRNVWWQSSPLHYGMEFQFITITIDLKQVYQVFFVILKSANSPRPASWILERSTDGHTFLAWQYFGLNNEDCMSRYGLPGRNGKYRFQNDTEVICSTQFSKPYPLMNGEIHVTLLKNRPSAAQQGIDLTNFIKAKFIRIRFQGLHQTFNLHKNPDMFQYVKQFSFYSLKQIRISARLECNGHADQTIEIVHEKSNNSNSSTFLPLRCICQHNTCGNCCEERCSLLLATEFGGAKSRYQHARSSCHCNGHSNSCILENFSKRNMCMNCQNSTLGNECEHCLNGFFRPKEATGTKFCLPCNCSHPALADRCKSFGGDCYCKNRVKSYRCECATGYFNSERATSACDAKGLSKSGNYTESCKCKIGVKHDGCQSSPKSHPDICIPCWCSDVGLTCSGINIPSLSYESISGWKITDISRTVTTTPLFDADANVLVYGMSDLNDETPALFWQAPQGYIGNRLSSYGLRLFVQLSWTIIRGDTSGKPISGPIFILVGSNNLTVAYHTKEFSSETFAATINITFDENGWYFLTNTRDTYGGKNHKQSVTREQFLSILSSTEALLIRATFRTDQVETTLHHAVFQSEELEFQDPLKRKRIEKCVCPRGYKGLSCEGCAFGFTRVYGLSDNKRRSQCVPCRCNGHSKSCDPESGICIRCMHNTYGERCEFCKLGYYGNPFEGTPNDCKRCACPLLFGYNNFSPSCKKISFNTSDDSHSLVDKSDYYRSGCPLGDVGNHCENCDESNCGDLTLNGSKCQQCDCPSGLCNITTIECFNCRENIVNLYCKLCEKVCLGDQSVGCKSCNSDPIGTENEDSKTTVGTYIRVHSFPHHKCVLISEGPRRFQSKYFLCICDKAEAATSVICLLCKQHSECKQNGIRLPCSTCDDENFIGKKEVNGCMDCTDCCLILLDDLDKVDKKYRLDMVHTNLQKEFAAFLTSDFHDNFWHEFNANYDGALNDRLLLKEFNGNRWPKLYSVAENFEVQGRKIKSNLIQKKYGGPISRTDFDFLHVRLAKQKEHIVQTILDMKGYGKIKRIPELPIVFNQSQIYIKRIRQRVEFNVKARSINGCAWQYPFFFENVYDTAFDLEKNVLLNLGVLNETNFRISAFRLQADKIFHMQEEIKDLFAHIFNLKNYLTNTQSNYDLIEKSSHNDLYLRYLDKIYDVLRDAKYGRIHLSNNTEYIKNMDEFRKNSRSGLDALEREIKRHWLPKAQRRSIELLERFRGTEYLFIPKQNEIRITTLANSIHKNISNTIATTKLISVTAVTGALQTNTSLHLPSNMKSVMELAHFARLTSHSLQDRAIVNMQKGKVLMNRLKMYGNAVEVVKQTIFNAGVRVNTVFSNLTLQVNAAKAEDLAQTSHRIFKNILERISAATIKIKDAEERLEILRKKLDQLKAYWEKEWKLAEEKFPLAKANIRLANISFTISVEQFLYETAHFISWETTVLNDLEYVHNKITTARHVAEGVKISLESPASLKCFRSYMPTYTGLTAYNSFRMRFALSSHSGNSPLMYVQGTGDRFISLEINERHVSLIWYLGESILTITHPLLIQTRDPKYDDAWYLIEANRTLNFGVLIVRRMNNYSSLAPSVSVSGKSEAGHISFYQERIYLGGYPMHPHQKLIRTSGLNVIVDMVEVDNQQIGLWNFLTSKGICGGSMVGAQETSGLSGARHFNGLGYAELKRNRPHPYRKNMFALQMTFKTFDENALLFLAIDPRNDRTISVSLRQGRIMLRIEYDRNNILYINSTERYNNRHWIKIEAARQFDPRYGTENGILRINNSRQLTGSLKYNGSHLLPNLSDSIYFFGGVPPGYRSAGRNIWGIDFPFLGCMRDVQVNGESFDPVESSNMYGVDHNCKEYISSAVFTGRGYLKLLSQSLRKRANVGFVLQTLQKNCLILLSTYASGTTGFDDKKESSSGFSFSLIDGHIQIWITSGRSIIKLRSVPSLNDGEFHIINLRKIGKRFELVIDDKKRDIQRWNISSYSGVLQQNEGFFIGGAPSLPEYSFLAASVTKFEGTIRDVIVNNHTINFNNALTLNNVQIGRGGLMLGAGRDHFKNYSQMLIYNAERKLHIIR